MICPNCGFEMKDSFCIHCGYMSNGNYISSHESNSNVSDLEIYLGDKYNKYLYNENSLFTFLLGHLYFGYHSFVFIGVLAFYIEFLCYYFFLSFSNKLTVVLCIIFRIIYASCSNMICLKLYQKRVDKIKRKDPSNYKKKLQDKNGKTTSILEMIICAFISFGSCICIFLLYMASK